MKKLIFEVQDFNCNVEEKDGKVTGLRMTGTALKEGISRNKRSYTIQNLKENDGESFNFIVGHREDYDNPDHNVGEGKYSLNGDKLRFDGLISNNHNHPDITEQVNKGLVSVSIQGGFTNVGVKDGKVAFEGLRIPILALVNKHTRGVEAASIESAIAERLEQDEVIDMSEDVNKQLKEKDDEITKLKEALHGKEEEERMKKMKEEEMKKKKMMESLMSLNGNLKEDELKSKSISELEIMKNYEDKLQKYSDYGVSEVQDDVEKSKDDGIVIERLTGNITMSESARLKFNNDILHSIYR